MAYARIILLLSFKLQQLKHVFFIYFYTPVCVMFTGYGLWLRLRFMGSHELHPYPVTGFMK